MKKFEDVQFNVEQVKRRGLDHFAANIKDLCKRGLIGYKEDGQTVVPSDKEIKDRYYKLTGFTPKAEKEGKS